MALYKSNAHESRNWTFDVSKELTLEGNAKAPVFDAVSK